MEQITKDLQQISKNYFNSKKSFWEKFSSAFLNKKFLKSSDLKWLFFLNSQRIAKIQVKSIGEYYRWEQFVWKWLI